MMVINWGPEGSVRSGQESYAQAQKGMPLPSLPGESLARQIPTTGIKQVRPALPWSQVGRGSPPCAAAAVTKGVNVWHADNDINVVDSEDESDESNGNAADDDDDYDDWGPH